MVYQLQRLLTFLHFSIYSTIDQAYELQPQIFIKYDKSSNIYQRTLNQQMQIGKTSEQGTAFMGGAIKKNLECQNLLQLSKVKQAQPAVILVFLSIHDKLQRQINPLSKDLYQQSQISIKIDKKHSFLRVTEIYQAHNSCYNINYTQNMDKQNQHKVLTPHNINLSSNSKRNYKAAKEDQLIVAVEQQIANNKECDLLGIILADPHLKQLNFSLQKQAEQLKKSKLLESFPLRYNNLVQTEVMYNKLLIELKQQKEMQQKIKVKYDKQVESLIDQIKDAQLLIAKKDLQAQQMYQRHCAQMEALNLQKELQIQQKLRQLVTKDSQISEVQKRYAKLKAQKDHITQFIDQLKDEAEVLRIQNDRIIFNLTQKQLEIVKLNETISNNEESFRQQIQNCLKKMASIQNRYHLQLTHKGQQYYQLEAVTDKIKANLKDCQLQLGQSLRLRQQLEQFLKSKLLKQQQEKVLIISEAQALKLKIQSLEQDFAEKQAHYNMKFSYICKEKQNLCSTIQKMELSHHLQLSRLKEISMQIQIEKNQNISNHQITILKCEEEKIALQKKIEQTLSQKQVIQKNQEQTQDQIEKLQGLIEEGHKRQAKYEKKQKDIQRMISQFKKQLQKFNQIIQQKEQKIQSYRKEILSLRKQVKEQNIQHQKTLIQAEYNYGQTAKLVSEKQQLCIQVQNWRQKCLIQQHQIVKIAKLLNKQKKNIQIQAQVQSKSQAEIIQLDNIMKELQKTKLKYQNIMQQLTLYKKQFAQQLLEKEVLIQQLQKENLNMKQVIDKRINDNKEIEVLLDIKIKELKEFYEQKIQQEGRKYRATIQTLKGQMTELYKDIDLKKSMEQEMFAEIMKINKDRKSQTVE